MKKSFGGTGIRLKSCCFGSLLDLSLGYTCKTICCFKSMYKNVGKYEKMDKKREEECWGIDVESMTNI